MRRADFVLATPLLVLSLACPSDDGGGQEGSSGGDGSGTGMTGGPTSTMGQTQATMTTMTTAVDSTGPDPLCGNGDLDGDEECDDGNNEDGDACFADCTIPWELAWTVSHNGPTDGFDSFSAVIVDDAGNVYALGNQSGTNGRDVFLQQYMPDGSEGWTYTYNGAMNGDDFGIDLDWHPSGDLLIAGIEATMEGDDILAIRVAAADQTEVWTQVYDGPGMMDNDDAGRGIAADSNGDVVVTGIETVDMEGDNVWVRKMAEADGVEVWTHTYNNMTENGDDTGRDLVIDGADEIIVSGNEEIAGDTMGWVRRLDAAGSEVWTNNTEASAAEIALDSTGNILLAGTSVGDAITFDLHVAKYGPDFTFVWEFDFNGITGSDDFGISVIADAMDNVYMTGSLAVMGQQGNVYTVKLGPDGTPQWTATYNNRRASLDDIGLAVAVDMDGAVIVGGSETVLGEQTNGWLGKYNQL